MTLREMQSQDLSRVVELEKICFSDPWTEEMFSSGLSVPFFTGLVIESEGELLAYACSSCLFEDAELLNIAVRPQSRGLGLAKRLMTEIEERAKQSGATRILLEVRKSNEPAQGLYRAFSYSEIAVRKKYYEDGEDALVMEKTL